MQELKKILEEIDQEVKEYMEIDFGDEYNAGIKDMAKMAKKIIRKHLSRENKSKTSRSSQDTDTLIANEVLDKLQFFGGQRTGRELWSEKPREVQDEDIANFNWDVEWLRDFICRMDAGWIPVEERLPEEAGTYIVNALNGERSIVTFAKWKNRYKRFDMTGARAYWRVIAWRPLPEPYQAERSKVE